MPTLTKTDNQQIIAQILTPQRLSLIVGCVVLIAGLCFIGATIILLNQLNAFYLGLFALGFILTLSGLVKIVISFNYKK